MINNLSFVTLVNNEELYLKLKKTLEEQMDDVFLDFIPIYADKKGWNAAKALNNGIEMSKTEWVVCVHQDVIFPHKWINSIKSHLNNVSPKVAVIGLVGIRNNGMFVGHIKDPHGHTKWNPIPSSVVSVDEHLIIIKKSSGICFDESTPGFHCYGTDICLTAQKEGFDAIVVNAPVVHLSAGKIDSKFEEASEWLLGKWGEKMNYVLSTCAMIIYKKTPTNFLRLFRIKFNRRFRSNPSLFRCDCKDIDYLF